MSEPYTLEIRENGRPLDDRPMPDPFHTTMIRPRGWRVLRDVLLRRYEIVVRVGADRETVERVSELDPDYKGAPGSKRRAEWDAELEGALGRSGHREAP